MLLLFPPLRSSEEGFPFIAGRGIFLRINKNGWRTSSVNSLRSLLAKPAKEYPPVVPFARLTEDDIEGL